MNVWQANDILLFLSSVPMWGQFFLPTQEDRKCIRTETLDLVNIRSDAFSPHLIKAAIVRW